MSSFSRFKGQIGPRTHTHTHSDAAFDSQTQQSEGEFKAPVWASVPCAGMCGTTGYEGGGGGRRMEGEGVRNADAMLQQPLSL